MTRTCVDKSRLPAKKKRQGQGLTAWPQHGKPSLVYRKNGMHADRRKSVIDLPARTFLQNWCLGQQNSWKFASAGCRLWKSACISTGADVQNRAFSAPPPFCPRTVRLGYNVFPALPADRKPLML